MKRSLFGGWKNPQTRPRYILLTGAAIIGLAGIVIAMVGVTSTIWFCSNICHKVMDDDIIAYNNSTHSKISCLQCHTVLGADPVRFLLHKAEFGIDGGYKVLTNTYTLPVNAASLVAFETPSEQCTQCHSVNRIITPSNGIKIDHKVHKKEGIACTVCHNRVAHPETHKLTLPGNKKHEDFMQMEACFRCHSQEADAKAPGRCDACHTSKFNLVPKSHRAPGFYTPYGDSHLHAQLALKDERKVAAAEKAASDEEAAPEKEGEEALPTVAEVSYCGQCHPKSFCDDCHKMPMPHPAGFAKSHTKTPESEQAVCAPCHADSKASAKDGSVCSDCHHKVGNSAKPWFGQHPKYARKGVKDCMKCHTSMYCETCHVSGKPKVAY